ncbi:VanZ family protein [Actinomycetales bacterium SN12]|nr:VanZ family protein [Actinomycetales bacterium SN12]
MRRRTTLDAGRLQRGNAIDTSSEGRSHVRAWPVVIGMALYGLVMLLIVFWPVPVDSGMHARALVQWIIRTVPGMTYDRVEVASNVAMFVPFGAGFALLLRRRWTVVLFALLTSASIEIAQALLLPSRTPSALDVLANTTGACVGVAMVLVWQWSRERG